MVFHEITQYSVIMRILVAIVIGGMLGLERGMKNRPVFWRPFAAGRMPGQWAF